MNENMMRRLYAIREDRNNGMDDNLFEYYVGQLCDEYGTEVVAIAMAEIGVDLIHPETFSYFSILLLTNSTVCGILNTEIKKRGNKDD